jgi:hypothetical protein
MRVFAIAIVALAGLCGAALANPKSPSARFSASSAEEACKQLGIKEQPLPAWALVLIKPLPRTTEAMLRLEHVHRAKNPLGPVLAGRLHWMAASVLESKYALRDAENDLHRGGLLEDEIKRLAQPMRMTAKDAMAIDFARKMTAAAHEVTDEEVAALIKAYGPDKVVAMVHTLAWANFRGRVLLALGVESAPDEPSAPVEIKLDKEAKEKLKAPPRPDWKDVRAAEAPTLGGKLDWRKATEVDLAKELDKQKARKPRIPLPPLDKFPEDKRERAAKIVWSHVSMGYQPLLTQTWFDTMGTFQQEAKFDRVFANSMFWVITRSNECFY